ncbi:MAG: hypothetical protein JWO62_543 [Acidimicrobiaceae bacterium]|jgi:DNA-binding GntR family transcriptional regulator|nr:hypothetical protein [Acidimicrobiaceae bacterium]
MASTAGSSQLQDERETSPWRSVRVPTRSVLADQVYELIKTQLMDHLVEPGARLSIDGLARDLGVSPTPVREALARLESDGLVAKRPHYGYTAAPLIDAKTFEELFKMRLLLEPASASWAAQAASGSQIQELQDLIAAMNQPLPGDGYESYRTFAAQDAAFHVALAVASGVGLMVETLERLRPHAQLYRLYYTAGLTTDTVTEHAKVLSSVEARDQTGAAAAMTSHLLGSRSRLAAAVNQ